MATCICSHCGTEQGLGTIHDLILYDRDWYESNGHIRKCITTRKHLYLCDACADEMEDFLELSEVHERR